MKNMKKLLGVITVLGFSTISAVNVTASSCWNSSELEKFQSQYNTAVLEDKDRDLAKYGLTKKEGYLEKYTFNFDNFCKDNDKILIDKYIAKPEGITLLEKRTGSEANQKFSQAATENQVAVEIISATEPKKDQEVVLDQQGKVDEKSFVQIDLKLVLWKSEKEGNTFQWKKQSGEKSIQLNVVISQSLENLITNKNLKEIKFIKTTTEKYPTLKQLVKVIKAKNSGLEYLTDDMFEYGEQTDTKLTIKSVSSSSNTYLRKCDLTYSYAKPDLKDVVVNKEVAANADFKTNASVLSAIKSSNPGFADNLEATYFEIETASEQREAAKEITIKASDAGKDYINKGTTVTLKKAAANANGGTEGRQVLQQGVPTNANGDGGARQSSVPVNANGGAGQSSVQLDTVIITKALDIKGQATLESVSDDDLKIALKERVKELNSGYTSDNGVIDNVVKDANNDVWTGTARITDDGFAGTVSLTFTYKQTLVGLFGDEKSLNNITKASSTATKATREQITNALKTKFDDARGHIVSQLEVTVNEIQAGTAGTVKVKAKNNSQNYDGQVQLTYNLV